ncbi:MBL fold metallo-hydrolase [Rugosimonospora africana]|uniref:MBL fold metallo-hydrolase n=1 Tax=Rugosimonospora africana TaxID=556532 RepID=A0A8J3QVP5_9ACTN|nr:MBL fold metallo-hydrolase [Rugosimonospora africana]GIH16658.1 MBL fold metallo-hydrolase [Rugosimonospora africana]
MSATGIPRRDLALTWLGQAGVVVDDLQTRVVIDPFIAPSSGRAVPAPDPATLPIDDVDAVLCTHEHNDHLHPDSLRLIRRRSPRAVIVVPEPLRAAVERELGGDVVGARVDAPVWIGNLEIVPLPAWHAVNTGEPIGDGSTAHEPARFLGYAIKAGSHVLFHAGDTVRSPRHVDDLKRLGVTVALLPINGRDAEREAQNIVGNLTAAEAVELARDAQVKVLVPIHYDMFEANFGDPSHAKRAADGTGVHVLELTRYEPTAITVPGAS